MSRAVLASTWTIWKSTTDPNFHSHAVGVSLDSHPERDDLGMPGEGIGPCHQAAKQYRDGTLLLKCLQNRPLAGQA